MHRMWQTDISALIYFCLFNFVLIWLFIYFLICIFHLNNLFILKLKCIYHP